MNLKDKILFPKAIYFVMCFVIAILSFSCSDKEDEEEIIYTLYSIDDISFTLSENKSIQRMIFESAYCNNTESTVTVSNISIEAPDSYSSLFNIQSEFNPHSNFKDLSSVIPIIDNTGTIVKYSVNTYPFYNQLYEWDITVSDKFSFEVPPWSNYVLRIYIHGYEINANFAAELKGNDLDYTLEGIWKGKQYFSQTFEVRNEEGKVVAFHEGMVSSNF